MPDESDPPRKFYGFKSSENFERANEATGAPSDGPTDVQGFIKSAAADPRALGVNAPANRPTDVHAMLQHNLKRDQAAGLYKVSLAPDPRRIKRVRNFWIALTIVDLPLGVFAWKIGHEMAIPFVCAIGCMAMFTSVLVWRTWCFRTEG